jgi:hypothetical protein
MACGGMPEDEKFDQSFEITYIVGGVTIAILKGLQRDSKVMHLFDFNPLINFETRC